MNMIRTGPRVKLSMIVFRQSLIRALRCSAILSLSFDKFATISGPLPRGEADFLRKGPAV